MGTQSNSSSVYGWCVFWSKITTGNRFTADELNNFLVDHNKQVGSVTMDYTFKDHTPKAAVGLARYDGSWTRKPGSSSDTEAKVVHENDTEITVGFLQYFADGEKQGKRRQIDHMTISKSDGSVLMTGSTDQALHFGTLYRRHLQYQNGNDVYNFVMDMLRSMNAVRLGRSNYFIADSGSNREKLDALRSILVRMEYEFFQLSQAKDMTTQHGLSRQVSDALMDRIDDVKKKIAKWQNDNKVHGRSRDSAFNEMNSIITDAALYESVLETSLSGVRDLLNECKKSAMDIVDSTKSLSELQFKSELDSIIQSGLIVEENEYGKVYLCSEYPDSWVHAGKLKKPSSNFLRSEGMYGFLMGSAMCLRPLAELEAALSEESSEDTVSADVA